MPPSWRQGKSWREKSYPPSTPNRHNTLDTIDISLEVECWAVSEWRRRIFDSSSGHLGRLLSIAKMLQSMIGTQRRCAPQRLTPRAGCWLRGLARVRNIHTEETWIHWLVTEQSSVHEPNKCRYFENDALRFIAHSVLFVHWTIRRWYGEISKPHFSPCWMSIKGNGDVMGVVVTDATHYITWCSTYITAACFTAKTATPCCSIAHQYKFRHCVIHALLQDDLGILSWR